MLKKILHISFFLFAAVLLAGCDGIPGILNPQGVITYFERKLLFDTTALMLIVVLPVIVMSIDFAYHYREKNHEQQITGRKVEYRPNWSHNTFLECLWWGVPIAIILVLGTMTWIYTHKLDPYKKIDYPGKITQVQVVALPWKWLFIYPEYNIATVNKLVLPNKTQAEFFLTSDNVPMSAFFVPQLGSQIYTMAGMQTKLHLIPSHTGKMQGLNTQYNGEGFNGMQFDVEVKEPKDFQSWATSQKRVGKRLNHNTYREVRKPEKNAPEQVYSGVDKSLFKDIIKSYTNEEHPQW